MHVKLLSALLLSCAALHAGLAAAEKPSTHTPRPVQLNGWYPCSQDSLKKDYSDVGHNDEYYMQTASESGKDDVQDQRTRRRTTEAAKASTVPLPFMQQSFDYLFEQHDWHETQREQEHTQDRHSGRQHAKTHAKVVETTTTAPQYECAQFRMPMCYDGVCESDRTMDVFVKRVAATEMPLDDAGNEARGKALWVLQGGPGASSTGIEGLMDTLYFELERKVSVYTMDHRGTGRSSRLQCIAAQAGALGSPGGSSIRLDEMPACIDDVLFQVDNQTAAFSVTSAAKDLATIIDTELADQDVFVYGLSYGTYLVERFMHVAPSSVRGFAVDGVVSESGADVETRATFSNWDHDVGVVAERFLAACLEDDFCKGKFPNVTSFPDFVYKLYDTLDGAVQGGKRGANACADALASNGRRPSYLLRSTLGEYLMDDRKRLAIPAVLYRAARCTAEDADALAVMVEGLGWAADGGDFGDSEPETLLYDSDMLYYLIVFSEMWETPTPDKQMLLRLYESSLMASDNYLSLPYYCVFTDSREQACQELVNLPPSRPLIYERDEYWNKTAELPPDTSALLMVGGLDLQTRRMYGELEFEMLRGPHMLVDFDDAGHCTTFTTPVKSGGSTCGVQILASYVEQGGDVEKVDVSCMDDLKRLKFSAKSVDVQELFGTADLYEDLDSDW